MAIQQLSTMLSDQTQEGKKNGASKVNHRRPSNNPNSSNSSVLIIASSDVIYDEEDILGAGAQATVYRAKWQSSDVVFKKLHYQHDSEEEHKQFYQELEVWRFVFITFIIYLY